jgi:hypothetical protein
MATAINEPLLIDGERHFTYAAPMRAYFALAKIEHKVEGRSAATPPTYFGTWEIIDHRLYLVGLVATLGTWHQPIKLEKFFPGHPDRVFAHWYTGQLRLPTGKLLRHGPRGHPDVMEGDLFLDVEKGLVVNTTTQVNGVAEDPEDALTEYRIRSLLAFAPDAAKVTDK